MISSKKNKQLLDIFLKILTLIIAIASALLFPKLGWWAADYLGIVLDYDQFSIGWDIAHHIVQALPPIFIMIIFSNKKSLSEWGFNNIESKKNKQIIFKFALGFIVFFTIGKIIYMW